jgi:predicted ABC-type transport system involved in lysophospholipase L1 biosynthesis ATPase subunit
LDGFDEAARMALRSRLFGFVFNAPYLLPELSVAENIAMPLFKVLDLNASEASSRTEVALAFAGLESVGGEPAGSLSRFDQQRVAFARAVAHQPSVLVLDHADHHLAEDERRQLAGFARRARRELGLTLLIQHEDVLPPRSDERVLIVENGRVREVVAASSGLEQSQ